MPSRVVRPDSTTLQISGGDWLLVKNRLNHGERQDAFALKYIADGVGTRVNLRRNGMDQVLAYLMDWSLTDLQERVIPIRGASIEEVESALNSIEPESFDEIAAAIEAHKAVQAAARAEEKKVQAGASASVTT